MIQQLLTVCDQEPIHMLSRIQKNGVLIVTDHHLLIHQISDNCASYFEKSPNELLEISLEILFDSSLIETIRTHLNRMDTKEKRLLSFTENFQEKSYFFVLHKTPTHIILEMSANELGNHSFYPSSEFLFQQSLRYHETSSSLIDMLVGMAKTVKEISGYDRVMIYKFDEDYNGTVLAQIHDYFTEDFTNHRFPASDIPVQARALYLKNRFRTINDVDDPSSVLIPALNPLTLAPLDMSHCYLRSVSPIHLVYLKNMGVCASMSVSLIINGKLWGLIVCHHHEPKKIPLRFYETYSVLSELFSSQIEQKERLQRYQNAFELRLQRELFFNSIDAKSDLYFSDAVREEIDMFCSIVPCDIAAYHADGEWISSSSEFSKEMYDLLIDYCDSQHSLFVSSRLGLEFTSELFTTPIGGIIISRSIDDPTLVVMFLRYEQIYTIKWAGEPAKHITIDNETETVSPRASFESWKETVRGTSEAFSLDEIESAITFTKELLNANKQFKLYDETRRLRISEAIQKERLLQNAIEQKILKERELILYAVGEGVYGVDLESTCFFVNPMACDLLGYSEQELIGTNTHDLIHYQHPDGNKYPFELCVIHTAIKTQEQQNVTDWLIRKNGIAFPARIIATPILKNDVITGVVVAFSDITEEYTAQQKLKSLHEQLFDFIEYKPD